MTNLAIPDFALSSEWGPEDPEVESVWVLLKDATNKLLDPAVKDETDFWADRIYEKLVEARSHFKVIRSEGFSMRPSTEQIAIYNAFYATLWSAYKDRLIKFLDSIGYKAGGIVSGDGQYESQMTAFSDRYPELSWLKELIDRQKMLWQDTLRDNRNPAQHEGDLRGQYSIKNINNPRDAKTLFIYVSGAIENIGICAISYKLPEYWTVRQVNESSNVFDREPRFVIEVPMTKVS